MSNVYTAQAEALTTKPSKAVTSQANPIPGRETEMALNNAGGFTFTLDKWAILDRFIMIGSESNGYYTSAKSDTTQAFTNTLSCIAEDGARTVARVTEYSLSGRAPKNDPAIVVLALCAAKGSAETQVLAYDALQKVCRTGTHLFLFVSILNSMGKWNAAAKRGVAKWYTNRSIEKATVQALKYQSRNGWSHRDVLRLAHIKPANELQASLFRYITGGTLEQGTAVTPLLVDFERLKRAADAKEVLSIIQGNDLVTWEMVPTQWLKDPDVLLALMPKMGLTAMIRQLGKYSAYGLISSGSEGQKLIVSKLSDTEALKGARVHPITLLQALRQYGAGRGEKGSLTWVTNQRVIDALDNAFYAAFSNVEDTGAALLMGVDCSGSMFGAQALGSPNLTAADVAAVLALAIVKNQSDYWIGGFNTSMEELKISPNMRLDTVLDTMRRFNWGGTDCAQPALHAAKHRMNVDKMIVITDNETWSGGIQPTQALRDYRVKMSKPNTSQIVIATSLSSFTVADPKDPLQLDIAGFDSAAPQIIAEFGQSW